jgi:very-short-patch-repair endonuclease
MAAGAAVSSPARTAIDLARLVPRLDALAVVDAALHVGACTADELTEQLDRQRRARGIVQARDIVRLADGRAESPMESRLRLRVIDGKLPMPEVQYWVCDENGRPVYRLDLAWPEYRLGLEYDGIDHLNKPRQRSDLERRGWLIEHGWRLISVTDTDVYRTYSRMLIRVRTLMSEQPRS